MTTERPTVLIVEDDSVYAAFARASLKKGEDPPGKVLIAGSLAEGLRCLTPPSRVDLILIDLGLPDSDGFDSFVAVRDRAPETAIIVLTGRDDRVLARRAVQEGAQDYIVKGSDGEKQLARSAGYAIERKRGERTLRRIARQQAAVAGLGQLALASSDTSTLLEDAVGVVARTLVTDVAEIYETPGGTNPLILRAAAGRDPSLVDQASVACDATTCVGTALIENHPMVFATLDEASRFVWPDWQDPVMASGAAVVIHGGDRSFGVLAVGCREPRDYSSEDVQFLELVAHVVGAAISREQVEEVFRVSEAGYRHILDTASEGICALNAEGRVTYVNRRAVEMLGYDSIESVITHPVLEFMFEQDQEHALRVLDGWKGGVQNQFDFRLRCQNGSELWVLASTSPILDQTGQFGGALVMFTDVTARRKAERALRESEARYRRIVETANEGIWVTDAAWRTEYVNRVMADIMGYPAGEMVGRSLLDFAFDDDRELVRQGIGPEREGPREPVEMRLRRKGGAEIWVLASTTTILSEQGVVEGLLVMCSDMTARRRAAAERARLHSAVAQAAEAIMMTKRDGTIVYVNPAWQRMTGYSSGEALGRTPRLLRADVQDSRVFKDLWETILDGRVWRGELTNRSQGGALFSWEETITPVRDESGRITEFISFGQDTSGRRDLEARLRQSQKMEAVGRLAGGVAHDFNNLLTVITGYSERLLMGLPADDPLRKGAEAIKRSADRAAALTQQLLAFSRRQILAPKVIDLNSVVGNMNKMLQRLIGEDVELVFHSATELWRTKADPNQLEQVIMNLAVNSRDAMPQGGILTIETSNIELDTSFAGRHLGLQPGRYVMLAVTDTGSGMDDETQSHLFEPFFTTKEQGKGTGLGLSTTYGIVKQSGGYIWVESEVGRGTTVRIYLPRIEETADLTPAAIEMRSAPHGSETILLVEDEDAVRHLLRDILRRYGYTVLEAQNGPRAIEICQQHEGQIDLVITDMVMPQMSGWEVADAASNLRPKAKLIYMSGYIEHMVVEQRVLESGVAFLGKPFTPDTLGRKVREVLDGEQAD
ncbi:MAG TPA: PAS domain S-box protein [Vicinamibacterales bacterium]|jgi:PAS domain S-box-containing protein